VLYTYLVRIAGRCLIGIYAMFDGRMGSSVCCRGTSERMLLMKDVVGGSWTEEASAQIIGSEGLAPRTSANASV
jgi:hypothetical protein